MVELGSLSIGDTRFEGVTATADDLSQLTFKGEPPAGVLGLGFFSEYLMTLDFGGERLVLETGELPESEGQLVLDFFLCSGKNPTVQTRIGDWIFDLHLDSTSWGAFSLHTENQERLELTKTPQVIGRTMTPAGIFEVLGGTLDGKATLGGHEISEPRVHFSGGFEHGHVGHGVLADFAVTFDQRNNRVRFVRSDGAEARLFRQAGRVARLLGEGPDLRDTFDADQNKVRLTLLVSPT